MILEIAMLQVRPGLTQEFEANFAIASKILSSMPGYLDHSLRRSIEEKNKYALLITWETLEAHTEGFRKSSEYLEWKALLHHFYDPFPVVEHFEDLSNSENP